MKKVIIPTLFLFASVLSYAQCTPNTATGTPGITPPPDSVTCIERGVPYSITMQFENFAAIGGFANMISATIDSITNFPCGIEWSSSKLTYGPGETGCIDVFGTTYDSVGQYPLRIYMTITAGLLGQAFPPQSGEITQLLASAGAFLGTDSFDVAYYSRVIETGNPCPAIDTTGANDLFSACLSVGVSGNTTVCAGSSTTLTATTFNETGTVSYTWSNGDTTASITVSPTTMVTYSVTVTDDIGSATASSTISVNPLPTASFTATVDSGNVVTYGNTSINATSFAWDFGDGTTSIVQIPVPKTYTTDGTVTIELIATNSCGSDTTTEDVTITGNEDTTFINSVEYDLSFDVYPNPSTGNVALSFSADNESKEYTLRLFDLSGKKVLEEKITATGSTVQKQLDLGALPKGVYTLHLRSSNGFGVKKLQLN